MGHVLPSQSNEVDYPGEDATPLTPAQILQNARALAPRLRQRIREYGDLRHLPDVTIEDVRDAGILSMMLPQRLGGAGAGLRDFLETIRVLAQADPSAAWTIGYLTEHNWMLGRWPQQVQGEVFRDGQPALMAGTFSPGPGFAAPGGKATPVDGGYMLTGHWTYASGIQHADWAMLGGVKEDQEGVFLFLVAKEDVEVPDSWYMEGMQRTGSYDVKVNNRFIPAHRIMAVEDWAGRNNPGSAIHPELIYSYDQADLTNFMVPVMVLGAIETLLKDYRDRVEKRRAFGTDKVVADTVEGQLRFARATSEVRIAQSLFDTAIRTVEERNKLPDPIPDDLRAMLKLDVLSVVRHARTAFDIISTGSGSGVYKSSDHTHHFVRDLLVLFGHLHIDEDSVQAKAGEALLGRLKSPIFF